MKAVLLLVLSFSVFAAETDAIAISRIIQARHMPYNTILDPVFASPTSDQIVSYSRCGDSAIWTGHYLAAEAFRYKVDRSAEALANARRAFFGIKGLLDVTGNNLLARCLVPVNSPYATALTQEEARHGVFRNSAQEPNYFWIGNTSRDQYSGVMFGLGVAYDLIDDPALRNEIRDVVRRIVDFLRGHNWNVVMPNGDISTTFIGRADQQLSFLQLARHVDPDRYSTAYDIARVTLSPAVLAPIALEVLDNRSYFKFNLDYINLYTLIRLENSSFGSIYRRAYQVLRDHTDDHQNAFFNMIDRALGQADTSRDNETLRMLDEWLLRSRRDAYVDLRGKYPLCGGEDVTCNPIPIVERVRTDFLWQRNPFLLYGGGEGTIETAGIDYILPYWMARSFNLSAYTVRSSASGRLTTAPDSIAAVYGLNLQNVVRVDVRDSAATTRSAAVFYTSAGQINFLVPAGTATGTATLIMTNRDGSTLTAAFEITAVAPAIFSANGTGEGVAAALVEAGRPGAQPMLVFSCSPTAQCTPVPIDVAATPYLSLYGTGLRGRRSPATATVGAVPVPVLYAGPQGSPGLDQVNVQLPLSLRGRGDVDVVLMIDGQAANTVRIRVQ